MEEILMGAVGPDDEESFGDNVVPISADIVPHQKPLIVSVEKQEATLAATVVKGRRISNIINVMENDEKLTYLIQGMLPDTGLLFVGGLSGTGKTILAIQIADGLVRGYEPMPGWKLGEAAEGGVKCLMLSLEMNTMELGERARHMFPNLSDEDRERRRENFLTYSEPEPLKLWDPMHALELIHMITESGAKVILIDSASVSFGESLKDDVQVNKSLDNLRMIRAKYGVAMIVVAHTRKPPAGIASNPEDTTLNELFGHSGVAQHASSIYIMMEDEKQRKDTIKNGKQESTEKMVHIICVKTRFGANPGAFKALLTSKKAIDNGEPLMFRRNAIPIAMTEEAKERAKKAEKPTLGEIWGDAFTGINFGAEIKDGEEDE